MVVLVVLEVVRVSLTDVVVREVPDVVTVVFVGVVIVVGAVVSDFVVTDVFLVTDIGVTDVLW